MKKYRPRIADEMLRDRLARKGAVLVEGPKWCGKTTTAEQQAADVIYMADPDRFDYYRQLSSVSMHSLLAGRRPLLIDEWQLVPRLWDAVRYEVDHADGMGQFILTGSSVPPSTAEILHSGVGRFAKLVMRPMSLYESGDSTGQVSLGSLFQPGAEVSGRCESGLDRTAYLICRGGWPLAVDLPERAALSQAFDYYDLVTDSDIARMDGVTRNPERVRLLMRSYARHQGAGASIGTILADMRQNESTALSETTLYDYIVALKRTFVIEDMPAWNPNLRSKAAIRTSDTRYFVDPGIAVAALGMGPSDLMNDLHTMGLFFETLCVRDLRVYAEALDGKVYHYRDKNGLECDAVVHLRNGSYGLIEIKLGGSEAIESGAATLKKLASLIDTDRMKAPAFLMVLVGVGEFAYRRQDGVLVVPAGCLRH